MASLLLGPVKRYITELLISSLSTYLEGVELEGECYSNFGKDRSELRLT